MRILKGKTLRRTLAMSCLASVSALAISAGAQAQTAAATPPAAAPDDSTVVIVTATKRATKLQETPIAISAFSQTALTQNHVKDVTDLARFVPSVAFTTHGDQGAILVTMRGVGNDSAFTELADPEVAIYVDGVYNPRAQGASVLMYDMDRVEVLRGPQGTLFGRNATVGAVSMVSAKPKLSGFDAGAEVTLGSYNRAGFNAFVNMPLSDTFALRAAFITDRHDGYVDYQKPPEGAGIDPSAFVTTGKKYDAQDQRSARLSALWKPSDAFSWNLSLEGYQDTGAPTLALLQTPRPGQKRWSALIDTAPEEDRYNLALRSQIDWSLSDDVGLTYIAGASRTGGSANSDGDAGALVPVSDSLPSGAFNENRTVDSRYEFYSNEIQLKSLGSHAIDWILGAYQSHEDNEIRFDIDQRNGYRNGTFAWAGAFLQADRRIETQAVFAQSTWHINDRFRLTGGLRYTSDSKADIGGRNVMVSGCTAAAAAADPDCYGNMIGIFDLDPKATATQLQAALAARGEDFAVTPNDVKKSWNKLTWLVRADANLWDGTFGYASVGTGFKGGNLADGGKFYGPETLTNYEVGTKSTIWGGRATLNLAAYYEDFVGYQVSQVVVIRDAQGNVLQTNTESVNAKGATAYGFEAEFNAHLTPADRLQVTLSAQHTQLKDLMVIDSRLHSGNDVNFLENLKGNELPHAPSLSGTIGYEHTFELASGGHVTPRISTHFESKSWLTYFNAPVHDEQPGYEKTDLSIKYEEPNRKWSVEAFVLNLENKDVKTDSSTFGTLAQNNVTWLSDYQPPRTWGVRLRATY